MESGTRRALLALMTGTTHLSALIEADGSLAFVGPSVPMLLGWHPDDMVGRNFSVFVHPEDLEAAINVIAAEVQRPARAGAFHPDADIPGEYRLKHADGEWIPFEVVRNNFLAEPEIRAILIVARPIQARYTLHHALGLLVHDPDSASALTKLLEYLDLRLPGTCSAVLVDSNPPEWIGGPRGLRLVGGRGPWEQALASGSPVYSRMGEPGAFDPAIEDAARAEGYTACWCEPLPIRHPGVHAPGLGGLPVPLGDLPANGLPDGRSVTGCLVVWSTRDADPPVGHLAVIERVGGLVDLAIRKRSDGQRLRQLVDFDQLTGALSRAGLQSMTNGSESVPRACVLLDLDDFKEVNDRHGHAVGDEVLKVAVKRVQAVMRYQDLLCRLGGDEFVILVAGGAEDHGVAVARRVLDALREPIRVGSVEARVGVSLGVAPFDPDVPVTTLIDRADQAMFAAKRHGKHGWELWKPTAG